MDTLAGSDLREWLQVLFVGITAVFTLLIAIDTNKAARAARDSAIQAHRAIQAQILSGLLDEYGALEMQDAISVLSEWYAEQNNDLAKTLLAFNEKRAELPAKLDRARRCVSHYIQKVTILWLRAGLLNKETALAALDKGQVQIYRELIEPLEWAITASYNRTSFDVLGHEYRVSRRIIPGLKGWQTDTTAQNSADPGMKG